MKALYLIRHAKSSWKDMSLSDFDRPLNNRGKRDAPFMAAKMSEFGIQPDAIISSPAKRALTTATHFARAADIEKEDIILEPSIYEAYPAQVLNVIRNQPDSWNTIFVFGHNPAFTMLADTFSTDYFDNVPTCGIVKITASIDKWSEFGPETGKVTAFHYPKQYFL